LLYKSNLFEEMRNVLGYVIAQGQRRNIIPAQVIRRTTEITRLIIGRFSHAKRAARPCNQFSFLAHMGVPVIDGPDFNVERKSYLFEAIKDTQGIIRALDFKANALLVVMTLLLANANKAAAAAGFLLRRHECIGYIAAAFGIVAIISGAISAWFAVLTLGAQFDPRSAVNVGATEKPFLGSFFAGGYFTFKTLPFIFGRFIVRAQTSLDTYLSKIPESSSAMVDSLAYEQLKVASIRDSKAKSIGIAYSFGVLSLALVAVIWLSGIMMGSDLP
jgi:hypothetical protein